MQDRAVVPANPDQSVSGLASCTAGSRAIGRVSTCRTQDL